MNPEIQPTSPLDLAGVAVATPAAGLVIQFFSKLCKKLLNRAICSRIRGDLKRGSAKGPTPHRWPWGVPAQDREKWARVEGPSWELWFVVFYKH